MSVARLERISQDVNRLRSFFEQPAGSPGQRQHDRLATESFLDLIEGACRDLHLIAEACAPREP